jgi:hypothetical protein
VQNKSRYKKRFCIARQAASEWAVAVMTTRMKDIMFGLGVLHERAGFD